MLRSPHAHATYTIDAGKARGMPGVALILTAAEVADLGGLPCLFNLETDPFTAPPYPILAKDEVRHVGDAIAFVVADTVDHARDAIEAIDVKWTPLPAVAGLVNAVKKGAPQVWPDKPGNVLFDVSIGDKGAAEAAFAKAHAVAEITIVNPRVITNFMETRAAVAEYDAKKDHLTLTIGSQGSHRLREILCDMILKMPKENMRVICPDVGGGFGTKLFPYREYALISVAARKLEEVGQMDRRALRPFHGRRAGPRQPHHREDGAGRGRQIPRHGCRPDGRHGRLSLDLCALHPAWRAPACCRASTTSRPSIAASAPCSPTPCRSTPIAAPAARGRLRRSSVWSMRPRVKLGMTPDAIRRKNFIPPKAMPYTTATGKVYDSGDFVAHMKRAMEIANWKEFPKRAKAAKKDGLVRGIGMASYVEVCGTMGEETANVRARSQWRHLDPDRHAVERAGPPDRLCADRRRAVRRAAGARPRAAGRHRQDRDRPRHRRLGIDPVRRRQRRSGRRTSSATS